MRLTEAQQRAIVTEAARVFGPHATVRLFGSRVDDAKQSGSTAPPDHCVIWWVRCA